MSEIRGANGEIGPIGRQLYESRIRSTVQTQENIGKVISIDVDSGDYEIGDDVLETAERLLAKRPGARLWGERIGYDAVFAIGGSLRRVAP